jgi:hypothetical protein
LKWTRAKDGNYLTSDCNRYMVNKASGKYMAVKLGAPDKGAWKGSVILGVAGTADEAKELCDENCNPTTT